MRRFQHPDPLRRATIAVACHHHARQRPIPQIFKRRRQLRRPLARPNHHHPPFWPRRQMCPQRRTRIGGPYRRLKQLGQKCAILRRHDRLAPQRALNWCQIITALSVALRSTYFTPHPKAAKNI